MFERRVQILGLFFLLIYCVLFYRLVTLQVFNSEALAKAGEQRLNRLEQIVPRRGTIIDRKGTVLAEDAPSCELHLYPFGRSEKAAEQDPPLGEVTLARVKAIIQANGAQRDMERNLALSSLKERCPLVSSLARLAGKTVDEVASAALDAALSAAKEKPSPYVIQPLLRDISSAAYVTVLSEQGLGGDDNPLRHVEARLGWRRIYPYGAAAAHITGYVGPMTEAEYNRMRGHWEPEGPSEGEGRLGDLFVPTKTEMEIIRLRENISKGETVRVSGYLLNAMLGRNGIEKVYNQELRGTYGQRHLRLERPNPNGPRVLMESGTSDSGSPGHTIMLTIDADIQKQVYDVMVRETRRLEAERNRPFAAACVLIDPHNGEIQAMVSIPSYNPQEVAEKYQEYVRPNGGKPLLNRVIQGCYAPGSTFKPTTGLGALSAGAIAPDTAFNCEGLMELGGHQYVCMHKVAHGSTTIVDALRQSCNVFFYNTGRALGPKKLVSFAHLMGYGQPTGIDLPYESGAHLPDKMLNSGWSTGNTFHLSIGQGPITATPLQSAVAISAIANGGSIVRPHLRLSDKLARPLREAKFSEAGLAAVRQGMYEVVQGNGVQRGTGNKCKFESMEVSGKTGSAEWKKGFPSHAWFVSYAPSKDPQVVLILVVPEGDLGGATAAPIAKEIYKVYFDIREDAPKEADKAVG